METDGGDRWTDRGLSRWGGRRKGMATRGDADDRCACNVRLVGMRVGGGLLGFDVCLATRARWRER